MILYPAIDLLDGRCVRLIRGDYQRETTYADDPVQVATAMAAAGASWLHVVDLNAAKSGQLHHTDTLAAIVRATGLKVQTGGGIRAPKYRNLRIHHAQGRRLALTDAHGGPHGDRGTLLHQILLGADQNAGRTAAG